MQSYQRDTTLGLDRAGVQAFILSRVGCCRLVLAMDSHVGDGCRRPFADGSGFSMRTFVTGYRRPGAVVEPGCEEALKFDHDLCPSGVED